MSCNVPLKLFNGFEVLHNDKAVADNKNYSKEQNAIWRKITANNINFKETRRPQVVVSEFPEQQCTFERHKIVPCE